MRLIPAFLLVLVLATPAVHAQDDQTLADVRQELNVLYVEIQRLRRELSTTGSPTVAVGGQSVLDRMASIEAEMQRLTSKTEQLEFRIGRIVEDGSNRIGDLEFRLVELEGGDVSQLGETTTLGGGVAPLSPGGSSLPPSSLPNTLEDESSTEQTTAALGAATGGAQLAVSEQEDFQAAQQALTEGEYRLAADRFAQFQITYPGSPLAAGADLGRGEALEAVGEQQGAARAFLASFSAAPTGPLAAQSLFRLGRSLGALNQTSEACLTLGEVEARFPADPAVSEARSEMQRLGCV